MRTLFELGRYWIFIKNLFIKPEKFKIYLKQILLEMSVIGYSSLGIVALVSIFMGAVITIQTSYNLISPAIPTSTIALVTRDTIIIEFSPTIIMLVLAGKVGSSIASELGTMRVTEQIDALEIMGINSAGYLVLPKIIASIFILPFVVVISMFLGIGGGWVAGELSGVIHTADYVTGLQADFIPYNVTFALTKTVVFAFLITSVAAYHGYYTEGGALEVGKSSTKGVVYSSILILIMDYVITQLMLA